MIILAQVIGGTRVCVPPVLLADHAVLVVSVQTTSLVMAGNDQDAPIWKKLFQKYLIII